MVKIVLEEAKNVRNNTIRILFDGTQGQNRMGVTFISSTLYGGVRVRALNRRDIAYRSGLRTGDVITHINSIAVTSHSAAVDVIETARANNIPLNLDIRRPWRFLFMRRFDSLIIM